MALRIIGLSCGLLLAAGLSVGEASAAGRGGGFGAAPGPKAMGFVHRSGTDSARIGRHARMAGHGFRHGAHRRWSWAGPGYADPWLFYPADDATVAVIERPTETVKPVDPDSFENLTARAGIRREPTPEPTIYRLEGSRLRPVAWVIRIGEAEPQGGRRTRFAHAETGALLLTVPRR
ncbi:hypothetical protein [Bosea sp. TAB14]|jgi:hypothetical protein|uniref:hypothetical protein n=1 Tax=Bosea sp. TAB14 TaxID=3237481 RepID=UPI003F915A92